MKTTKTTFRISKRTTLISAIMLVTLSTNANTFNAEENPLKGNMFVFYLTGVLFFTLYFLYVKIMYNRKNMSPVRDLKQLTKRRHYHYRKIVRKTA